MFSSSNGSVCASWRGRTVRYDKFSLGTSALDRQQVIGVNGDWCKRWEEEKDSTSTGAT
jgi:hypothetical protein